MAQQSPGKGDIDPPNSDWEEATVRAIMPEDTLLEDIGKRPKGVIPTPVPPGEKQNDIGGVLGQPDMGMLLLPFLFANADPTSPLKGQFDAWLPEFDRLMGWNPKPIDNPIVSDNTTVPALAVVNTTVKDKKQEVVEKNTDGKEVVIPIIHELADNSIKWYIKSANKNHKPSEKTTKKITKNCTEVLTANKKKPVVTKKADMTHTTPLAMDWAKAVKTQSGLPFMHGDVSAACSNLWNQAADTTSDAVIALKNNILWGSLSAISPPTPSLDNGRTMTKWGKTELKEATMIDVAEKRKISEDQEIKKNITTPKGNIVDTNVTKTYRSSTRGLTLKAGQTAARIKSSGPRISGLLETAGKNRVWVTAVLSAISASSIGPQTRNNWVSSFRQANMKLNKAKRASLEQH